jgi:hypothetical protein
MDRNSSHEKTEEVLACDKKHTGAQYCFDHLCRNELLRARA